MYLIRTRTLMATTEDKFLVRRKLLFVFVFALSSCSPQLYMKRTAPYFGDALGTYIYQKMNTAHLLQLYRAGPKLDSILSRYIWLTKPHQVGTFVLTKFGMTPYEYSAGVFMFFDPVPPTVGDDIAVPPQDFSSVMLFNVKDSILSKANYFLTGTARYDSLGIVVLDVASRSENFYFKKLE